MGTTQRPQLCSGMHGPEVPWWLSAWSPWFELVTLPCSSFSHQARWEGPASGSTAFAPGKGSAGERAWATWGPGTYKTFLLPKSCIAIRPSYVETDVAVCGNFYHRRAVSGPKTPLQNRAPCRVLLSTTSFGDVVSVSTRMTRTCQYILSTALTSYLKSRCILRRPLR